VEVDGVLRRSKERMEKEQGIVRRKKVHLSGWEYRSKKDTARTHGGVPEWENVKGR